MVLKVLRGPIRFTYSLPTAVITDLLFEKESEFIELKISVISYLG